MSYALLSDDLLLRLESSGVSRDARLLHVEAIVYCATALTDGDVLIRLPRISDAEDSDACAEELVDAGLWERISGGYRVLDGMEHQRSRDEVELARQAARERKERSRRHKLGDHSMCLKGRYCPDGRVTRDRTRDGTRDGTPTNPIPSNPAKDKDGKEDGAGRARERAPAPSEADDDDTRHLFAPGCCNLPAENHRHFTAPAALTDLVRHLRTQQCGDLSVALPTADDRERYSDVAHVVTISQPGYFWHIYTNSGGRIIVIQAWTWSTSEVSEDVLSRFRETHGLRSCRIGVTDDGCGFLVLTGRRTEDDVRAVLALPDFIASQVAA